MKILRKNSRAYKILKYLALGSGILIVSTIAPVSGVKIIDGIIGEYFYKKRFRRDRFLRDLKNLQIRKLVDYKELDNGKIRIVLEKNGKEKFLLYNLDEIKLKKISQWDKKWRLVMFDIPHHHKMARDAFRRKLNDLEFYSIQKSVFITPYECEDEIDFIAKIFEVRKYVLILYVSGFEGEEKFKYHFGL